MTIRTATTADVASVLPMVANLAQLHESWDSARYDYKPDTARMYETWLAARAVDSDSVFLVAEREPSHIVGFLVATLEKSIPIYRIEKFGFIHDLWVDENYRHEGLARQMTMLAIERFRALGAAQVRLEAAVANDAARKLFESCGFRSATIEMLLELG